MPMRVVRLGIRHWQEVLISLLVVGLAFVIGGQLVQNADEDKARQRERQEISAQFCAAIPNAAAAGAQALVDVVIADRTRRGVPDRRIVETVRLGDLYIARARELALRDLPDCPQPTESP